MSPQSGIIGNRLAHPADRRIVRTNETAKQCHCHTPTPLVDRLRKASDILLWFRSDGLRQPICGRWFSAPRLSLAVGRDLAVCGQLIDSRGCRLMRQSRDALNIVAGGTFAAS